MKEIGGYFELELSSRNEFHIDAVKLNSGRNAFKYLLHVQRIHKVYLPIFICNSMIEPLKELNIEYEFYNIDEKFEIIDDIVLLKNEKLLYVNYYALKTKYIYNLANRFSTKLIIDNTHAFFNLPIKNVDTLYSPRKFFGISDGGYLYTNQNSDEVYEEDVSANYSHLIGRIESGATLYFTQYQQAEKRLENSPIKIMSKLTNRILKSIDYEAVKTARKKNFDFLHNALEQYNGLKLNLDNLIVPFTYPFMTTDSNLRTELIRNKIYVAKYWNEVLSRQNVNICEKNFVNRIIPLPIDQRYSIDVIKRIVDTIRKYRS